MKYLKKSTYALAENAQEAAWESKLGHPKNPEDVTRFGCTMITDEATGETEIHVCDDMYEHFTSEEQSLMTDEQTIFTDEG
jgi:hypothetical protein